MTLNEDNSIQYIYFYDLCMFSPVCICYNFLCFHSHVGHDHVYIIKMENMF